MSDETIKAIRDFKSAFEKVEKILKMYELSAGKAFLPAINELRYAGFDALSGYEEATGYIQQTNSTLHFLYRFEFVALMCVLRL